MVMTDVSEQIVVLGDREPEIILPITRPTTETIQCLAESLLASLEDPADGAPDQSPEAANLAEAGVGAEHFCGNCRFWIPPEELREGEFINGTCSIVTGVIEYDDVCDFHETKATPADGVVPPGMDTELNHHDDDEEEDSVRPITDDEGSSGLPLRQVTHSPAGIPASKEEKAVATDLKTAFAVDEDNAECIERTDGEAPVAVVDDEGNVLSCHATAEEARDAEEAEGDEGPEDEETAVSMSAEEWDAILTYMTSVADALEGKNADEFAAVRSHDTCTNADEWDGSANEARARSGEGLDYYRDIYAWQDPGADAETKAAWRFVHHFVGEDGAPGCASTRAASSGIAVLNGGRGGTTIPADDRQGVYDHLARHLRDADLEPPELMSLDDALLLAAAVDLGGEVDFDTTEGLIEAATAMGSETDFEAADQTQEFGALPSHDSATVNPPTFTGWNGNEAEKRVRSGEEVGYYGRIYAWRDEDKNPGAKDAYKFIHHEVSTEGNPGAAVMWAAHSAIAVIDDSTIPTGDYQAVFNHLARHLRDGGMEVPELGGEPQPIREVENAIREMRVQWIEAVAQAAVSASEKQEIADLGDSDLVRELVRRWVDSVDLTTDDQAELEELTSEMDETTVEEEAAEFEAGDEAAEFEADEVEEAGGLSGPVENPGEIPEETPTIGGEFAEDFEWEGVIIVEGLPSGDGRMVAQEALTWRELPLPLMLQTRNAQGHDGSVIAGSIHELERVGQNIIGRGKFDSGDHGQEAKRLITEGTMRGVSADIDSVVVEFQDPDGGNEVDPLEAMLGGEKVLEVLVEGRIMGATLTPFPAFQEAHVSVITAGDAALDEALVAAGYVAGDVWNVPSPYEVTLRGEEPMQVDSESLVASATAPAEIPVHPPKEWFALQEMDEPQEFMVTAEGRCYGLIAQWGTCHIGFNDRCVQVPKSRNNFGSFHKPGVVTEDGEQVLCGPVFMDTVHPNLRLVASDAQAHYADTGCAVANVTLYENEFGIVAAGALLPDVPPEQAQRLRGSDISPDWRRISGGLEVVGLLAVNVSGFIVEGLVASGGQITKPTGLFDSKTGEVRAMVAAGMVRKNTTQVEELRSEIDLLSQKVEELSAIIRPIRAERLASKIEALVASGDIAVNNGGSDGSDETTEESSEEVVEEAHECGCGNNCSCAS